MNDNTFSELPPEIDETFHQELRDDMKRLANNNAQPTNNAWEAIMEESTTHHRRISRRTRLVSAAAAAAVILAITGGFLVVASNGGTNESIKTVDKKKKDPVATSTTTTTTIPKGNGSLTEIYLKSVPLSGPSGGSSFDVYSSKSNSLIGSLPTNDPENLEIVSIDVLNVEGGKIVGSRYNQCDIPSGNFVYDIKSGKTEDTGRKVRIYSPSGKKYAEYEPNCDALAYSTTIVDVKTGKRRELKPEASRDGGSVYITNLVWVDENRFTFKAFDTAVSGASTLVADLRKTISIANAPGIPEIIGDSPETFLEDIILVKGKTYVLVSEMSNIENVKLNVFDFDSQTIVWTKDIKIPQNFVSEGNQPTIQFNGTENSVIGTLRFVGAMSFTYDHASDLLAEFSDKRLIPNS